MTVHELKAEVDRIVGQVRALPVDTRRESFLGLLGSLPAYERELALAFVAADVEFQPRREHFVVLIHGIRTHANWAEMVASVLEREAAAKVLPLKYGFFDLVRFLCPIFTRKAPVDRIIRELRDLRAQHPTAHISAVAHSFGTYALIKALREPDIRLHRIILCGCIVKETFRRALHEAQLSQDPILNDCGTHDIWPVLAKTITWGYGASGTFGFGTVGIRDRFNKFGHSGCFDEHFVQNYWVCFIREGEVRSTEWERMRTATPYWISFLAIAPLRWVLLLLLTTALLFASVKLFAVVSKQARQHGSAGTTSPRFISWQSLPKSDPRLTATATEDWFGILPPEGKVLQLSLFGT